MKASIILDAGPLVALLNPKESHHLWVTELVKRESPPFLTCEAVLTEVSHLMRSIHGAQESLLEFVERRLVQCRFRLEEEIASLRSLTAKYADLPMSLADACLVRMAELNPTAKVLTLDRNFKIYRKNNRQVIPTIMPIE